MNTNLPSRTSKSQPNPGLGRACIPYATDRSQWLVDAESVVSRNDVLYTSPSPEPWEAMPVGGGDLSAMVRWDGDLHLHLTKSDCWGFQEPADAPRGSRFFNNVSPGHVRLIFGEQARQAASRRLRQRLDLYRGRIVIEIGQEGETAQLQVWGHPELPVLVIEMSDPSGLLGPIRVELTEWRETMQVTCTESLLQATEVHTRPARPHLASAGMDDYYAEEDDPLQGRGSAVVIGSPDVPPECCSIEGRAATMELPQQSPSDYRVMIATAVTESGDPLPQANTEFGRAATMPTEYLRRKQRQWWQQYWQRSFVRVTSADRTAEWINAAYYVHMYTLACTNRGPVPAKWDGGAGLMRGDERNWGISEWVQEMRFTFMPLYAANRLEMARGFCDFYSAMTPYLKAQTERLWGRTGLFIPETVAPWGHAEDWVMQKDPPQGLRRCQQPWEPDTASYGKFHHYNPYIGFLFTAGLEVCQHFLTYARYSGDDVFLHEQAYPIIRDVCGFVTSLLQKEQDGRYHLAPANALETWWMARDPADTLDGLRAIGPEFIRLAAQRSEDGELRDRCSEVLEALPDPTLGLWREDGNDDPDEKVYSPAADAPRPLTRSNCENPQLYRIYPFGLSGIGSADYDLARRTFEKRICMLEHGWAMDAIWAARLGSAEEACLLLTEHARRYNRYRYGGWDSNDNSGFPNGLSVAPFLDGAGLSAFALQEILLQSHGGVIRIGPAVSATWSGAFRLLAEGGFLVTADIAAGQVRLAEVESLQGGDCTLSNPWPGQCAVSCAGEVVLRSDDRTVSFPTQRGATYLLESIDRPVSSYEQKMLRDPPNERSGLPGRDG